MKVEDRISAFVRLKSSIESLTGDEKAQLYTSASQENPWFTAQNIEQSLKAIAHFLTEESLKKWLQPYNLNSISSKKIGVAMAGNIPLVGFHDLLCVLIAGHTLVGKVSSQDKVLMTYLSEQLKKIEPRFIPKMFFEERLKDIDAIIATGSDNTSRYFEYYFRNIPHIIRKNRSSCALIMGEESDQEIVELGIDLFSYFGLGCRNVSKLFIPDGYEISHLLTNWEGYREIVNHHKYANNYDYQKCIMLMNQTPFYDGGQVLLQENTALVSPIGVVYYEYYKNQEELAEKLKIQVGKIQCIVSANGWYPESVPFGKAQFPSIRNYADNIDTLQFLTTLT